MGVEAICEAIETYLGAQSFTEPLIVDYVPDVVELTRDDAFRVSIYPYQAMEERTGRGCTQETNTICLLVTRGLTNYDRARCVTFVEALRESIRYQKMAGYSWTETLIEVLWDNETQRENDTFSSVLHVAYTKVN